MANTYTQIYIHVIFAVESRQSLIMPEHNDDLPEYLQLLDKFGVEYDQRYIFKFVGD